MKKFICPVLLILLISSSSAYSQKYRTVADTAKLNAEYIKVSNDIADLTAKLTIAQNNLPKIESKANAAGDDAQNAAAASSDKAAKVTGSSVSDARKAKREAKKAYKEAKDARSANNNVANQEEKIAKLTKELNNKKDRLRELETMRTAINAQIPQ